MCGSGAAIGLPPLASNAPAPRNPAGLWQAGGFWNSRVFILGEQFLSTQTPADLLPTKALQSSDFADGRTLLKVDDARFAVGADVGVWTDHAADPRPRLQALHVAVAPSATRKAGSPVACGISPPCAWRCGCRDL
jgi:hypothetical protein